MCLFWASWNLITVLWQSNSTVCLWYFHFRNKGLESKFGFFLFPNWALNSAVLTQLALLGINLHQQSFLTPMPRQGIEPTSVSRVAPDWDLSDALPTELHGRGLKKSWRPSDKENSMRLTLLAFSLLRMRPRSMLPISILLFKISRSFMMSLIPNLSCNDKGNFKIKNLNVFPIRKLNQLFNLWTNNDSEKNPFRDASYHHNCHRGRIFRSLWWVEIRLHQMIAQC